MKNEANEEEGLSLKVVEKKDVWWLRDLPHENLQELQDVGRYCFITNLISDNK